MSNVKHEFVNKESKETKERRRINRELQKKLFRGQSNLDFSKTNQQFRQACENVGIPVTARQASKYRNKQGKAYTEGRK